MNLGPLWQAIRVVKVTAPRPFTHSPIQLSRLSASTDAKIKIPKQAPRLQSPASFKSEKVDRSFYVLKGAILRPCPESSGRRPSPRIFAEDFYGGRKKA